MSVVLFHDATKYSIMECNSVDFLHHFYQCVIAFMQYSKNPVCVVCNLLLINLYFKKSFIVFGVPPLYYHGPSLVLGHQPN